MTVGSEKARERKATSSPLSRSHHPLLSHLALPCRARRKDDWGRFSSLPTVSRQILWIKRFFYPNIKKLARWRFGKTNFKSTFSKRHFPNLLFYPSFSGGWSGTVKQSLSKTKVKITRRVEKIAMAWFFILNQQGHSNEDIVTSSKLTATNM